MVSQAEERLKLIPEENRTGIKMSLVGFTAKKSGGYYGRTNDGQTYFILHACVYGSKKTPAWWVEISLWGSLADQALKLPLERCLVRASGDYWQVEYGQDKVRQTRLKTDTFGYRLKDQDWVDLKRGSEADSPIARRLASGD